MTKHAFDVSINGLRFMADVCPNCAGLPTELDALRAMEARRPHEPTCAACGEIPKMLWVTLRHAPDPDHPGQERWVAGYTAYLDVLHLEGVADYPIWAHGLCVARAFPFLPTARRDHTIQSRRQKNMSIQAGVADGWTSEPLDPTAPGKPTCFFGDFEAEVDADGALQVPAAWASGERNLMSIVSPVEGEHCIRVYEATSWARTLVAMRAYGTPEPANIRPIEISRGGRLTPPKDQLAAIGVQGTVHVVGAVSWMELWEPSRYAGATCPAPGGKSFWSGRKLP